MNGDGYGLRLMAGKGQAGGVPLFSENRHVRRIYRLAVQSVAKMGIQGGFTGLQGHFYWGLLYKDLQNLASRSRSSEKYFISEILVVIKCFSLGAAL